jgi:hypothetical protein
MINNFLDLQEEKDLYEKLKKSGYRESKPKIHLNLKPILKTNINYSKTMFATKMVGFGSGLTFLYNLFYLDNPEIMNGLYIVMGMTSLFGMFKYIKYWRDQNNDHTKANYDNLHQLLEMQTPESHDPSAPTDGYAYSEYSYMQEGNEPTLNVTN